MRIRACAFIIMICSPILIGQNRGKAPDDALIYDVEYPGTWTLKSDFRSRTELLRPTAAETSALSARIAELAEVIHGTPAMSAPRGIEVRAEAGYDPDYAWWSPSGSSTGDPASTRNPLMAKFLMKMCNFVHTGRLAPGKTLASPDLVTTASFLVNAQSAALTGGASVDQLTGVNKLLDGRPLCLRPLVKAKLADFPLYTFYKADNIAFLVFTNGRPVWVAATREQLLNAQLQKREKELEELRTGQQKSEKEYQEAVANREAQLRETQQMLEQAEKDPAKRQKMIQEAVKMQDSIIKGMAKGLENGRQALKYNEAHMVAPLREELQRLSPDERASPAWVGSEARGRNNPLGSGLMGAGAKGARELMTLNLEYFDTSRPRSDIQLIVVKFPDQTSQDMLPKRPDYVASTARLYELMTTADWKRVAAFVVPAR